MAEPDRLNVAILGAGRWGKCLIGTVQRLDGFALKAVASSNPETRSLVPHDCMVTADWRAAVGNPDVSAVLIATPPALHLEMTRLALMCGKPVFLEKPMTMVPQEAQEILRLSGETGIPVIVDHIHLFSEAFQGLKAHLHHIGRIRVIRGEAGNKGPVRHDASVLWDWGPHDLAMILNITGLRPQAVQARRVKHEQTPDGMGEHIRVALHFGPEQADCAFDISNIRAEKRRHFSVEGEFGSLQYDDLAADKLVLQRHGQSATPLALPGVLSLDNALGAFRRTVQGLGGLDHEALLEQSAATVDILHECSQQLSMA